MLGNSKVPEVAGDAAQAGWRARLGEWLERPRVQHALIALILINAVILGLETSKTIMAAYGPWLVATDRAILGIFVVEIALRIAVHRGAFFRDAWSVFDFVVVAIALLPASGPFAVLRALRVLRVLRLLTMVPSMRRVVAGLLSAIPGLTSVVAIIGIIFYVGAVIATKLFSERFPDWFGTLGESAYSLFQIMTLESWSMGIVRPVMEVYPYAWAYFIPFIMISTFTMLNLFIAVIVNAIQSSQHVEAEHTERVVTERIDADSHELHVELVALRHEVGELKRLLERAARDSLSR
jgi:voltage-gated sodium channel